jgi:hypothetical protein
MTMLACDSLATKNEYQIAVPQHESSVATTDKAASDKLDPWQVTAIKQIIALKNLEPGWDDANGPPPGQVATKWAIKQVLGMRLGSLATPEFGPKSGGGLQIDWWSGQNREIEFHVEPSGILTYLKVEAGEPIDEGRVTENGRLSVEELMNWLRRG